MWKRILTAVVLLTIVLGTLFGLRQINLLFADLLGVLVIGLGAYELFHALKEAEYKPMAVPIVLAVAFIYPATYFLEEVGILILLSIVMMIAFIIFTFKHEFELKDLFATSLIIFYPITMFAPFFLINHSDYGMLGIMLMLFVPILTDTMAYFTGITFKGPKLCPDISPKKTISGAIGGVLGGILGSVVVFLLFDFSEVMAFFKNAGNMHLLSSFTGSIVTYVILGLIGGVLCELGDLAASWIKRKANIKDFGKIFPGHGGMLDRLDSILFMVPIVYMTISLVEKICVA